LNFVGQTGMLILFSAIQIGSLDSYFISGCHRGNSFDSCAYCICQKVNNVTVLY